MNDSFQLSFTHVQTVPVAVAKKEKNETWSQLSQNRYAFQAECDTNREQRWIVLCLRHCDDQSQHRRSPKWPKLGGVLKEEKRSSTSRQAPRGRCSLRSLWLWKNWRNLPWLPVSLTIKFFWWMPRTVSVKSFGPPEEKQLVLLYDNGHYDILAESWDTLARVISVHAASRPTTMKVSTPLRTTRTIVLRACETIVPIIQKPSVENIERLLPCFSCKRFFHGDTCLHNHLTRSYTGNAADAKHISVCS